MQRSRDNPKIGKLLNRLLEEDHRYNSYNLLLLDKYKNSINFKTKIPSSGFDINLRILNYIN